MILISISSSDDRIEGEGGDGLDLSICPDVGDGDKGRFRIDDGAPVSCDIVCYWNY